METTPLIVQYDVPVVLISLFTKSEAIGFSLPSDFIFADTWLGKYNELHEALAMVKPGGLYVDDDMTEQPNWPEGHAAKAENLVTYQKPHEDFNVTVMDWGTR